jgi:hypothetical protein
MHQYPQRSVEENCLYSSAMPALRVQLARGLEYLGNLKSKIRDVAHIDNYYFAERDETGTIQRIVYLQFENYFPDVDASHDYPSSKPIQLGNFDFLYDGGVRNYRQSRIDELDPETDVVQTVAFLKEKGVQFKDGEYYGSLRFVHVIGESRRDEVLILYLERMEEADIPLDVVAHSRQSGEWPAFCEKFLARALTCFTVCED